MRHSDLVPAVMKQPAFIDAPQEGGIMDIRRKPTAPLRALSTSGAAALLLLTLVVNCLANETVEGTLGIDSVATRAVGAGRWESVQDAGEKRDWQIQVERYGDGAIEGSIIVVGSPYLHKARLVGRVDGSEVYGVLLGDGEKQVGTFSGTVGDTGLSGTYRTEHGDSGNWSWPGPAAAQSMKEEKSD
jgi:hypothetical protein